MWKGARGKGKQGQKVSAQCSDPQLVIIVDVAPTLSEAPGLKVPKEIQGRSLLPPFRRSIRVSEPGGESGVPEDRISIEGTVKGTDGGGRRARTPDRRSQVLSMG